jgi:hypothetical protein
MQRPMSADEWLPLSGAPDHTGRFVVKELLWRGVSAIAIGRDENADVAGSR